MLKRYTILLLLLFGGIMAQAIDRVQLRNDASVSGTILLERPNQVVIDIGYTALVIPRNQILKVTKGAKATLSKANTAATNEQSLYYSATTPPPVQSVRSLVKQYGEAVVQVKTPSGLGSGFILDGKGYLITNFHVIQGENQITVEVYHRSNGTLEPRNYKKVRIIALNKFADLALLKIEDPGAPKFPHVILGRTDTLAVGQPVFAIGSPLGLERTVTEGILSSKTRELQGILYLQTTAQINPGNSGGPLFNLRGQVIGITNMKVMFGEGLGFAIPIERVRYFLEHRNAFAYDNDNPNNPYRYLPPPSRYRPKGKKTEATAKKQASDQIAKNKP